MTALGRVSVSGEAPRNNLFQENRICFYLPLKCQSCSKTKCLGSFLLKSLPLALELAQPGHTMMKFIVLVILGGFFALWRVFLSGLPWRLECYHGFRSGFSALGQPCQFSQAGKIGWKLMPSPPAHQQTLSLFISLLFEDTWEMLGLLPGQVQHQLCYLLLKIFLLLLITGFDICI